MIPDPIIHSYVLGVNPEPWTVGTGSVNRKNGGQYVSISKDEKLRTYQEAVREELQALGVSQLIPPYHVRFYFSRQLIGNAKFCDETNMQKATEDALQDLLIGNDRDNIYCGGFIVAQHKDMTADEGWVAIEIAEQVHPVTPFPRYVFPPDPLPETVAAIHELESGELRRKTMAHQAAKNVWPPKESK